ncbi:ogr/Delta-like zinc finger family protein [Rugamonas sp. A1-17]|nr:ogr/Delta-like zinc finger family protein [Rugamonas sp. A1-17]
MRITIRCPICTTRAIARSSRELSATLREIIYRCENDGCGHIYVANLEVMRTLVPSILDNPDVKIPLTLRARSNGGSGRSIE